MIRLPWHSHAERASTARDDGLLEFFLTSSPCFRFSRHGSLSISGRRRRRPRRSQTDDASLAHDEPGAPRARKAVIEPRAPSATLHWVGRCTTRLAAMPPKRAIACTGRFSRHDRCSPPKLIPLIDDQPTICDGHTGLFSFIKFLPRRRASHAVSSLSTPPKIQCPSISPPTSGKHSRACLRLFPHTL